MKKKKELTVVIPAYNEEKTLEQVINKVLKQPSVAEVIVIDDNSTDRTAEIIKSFGNKIRSHRNQRNKGKGYGVRKGIELAKYKYLLVQDADLEYDPQDYAKLLRTIHITNADLVNSVRDFSSQEVQLITRLGSRIIPDLVFLLFGKSIKDIVSCYKLMKTSKWKELKLSSDRFELETEIMIKAIIKNFDIHEVDISYNPRSKKEGKHIGVKDGLKVAWMLISYKLKKNKSKLT